MYIYIYIYTYACSCMVSLLCLHPLTLFCLAESAEDKQVLTAELVAEFDQGKAGLRH